MGNYLSPEKQEELLKLAREGEGTRAIARALGIDATTVRSYRKLFGLEPSQIDGLKRHHERHKAAGHPILPPWHQAGPGRPRDETSVASRVEADVLRAPGSLSPEIMARLGLRAPDEQRRISSALAALVRDGRLQRQAVQIPSTRATPSATFRLANFLARILQPR